MGGKNKDITAELNSQLPRLGKAIATVPNDDVVKYPDINQRQCTLDPLCDALVSSAGFGLTAGMVVCQDDRSSIRIQSGFDDLARIGGVKNKSGRSKMCVAFRNLDR